MRKSFIHSFSFNFLYSCKVLPPANMNFSKTMRNRGTTYLLMTKSSYFYLLYPYFLWSMNDVYVSSVPRKEK